MPNSKENKLRDFIVDRTRRINIKRKRRRNMFKKVKELDKSMCGLEVLVILKDVKYNQL